MKILQFLLLSICCSIVHAQQIQKKIINSTGITYHSNNITLKVSVGEPIVGFIGGSPSASLSQGFFTGFTRSNSSNPPPAVSHDSSAVLSMPAGYNIYPNPVKDILFIRGDLTMLNQICFFDIRGRQVFNQNIASSSIMISGLPAGFYIAKLVGKSGETLHVFKIVKL